MTQRGFTEQKRNLEQLGELDEVAAKNIFERRLRITATPTSAISVRPISRTKVSAEVHYSLSREVFRDNEWEILETSAADSVLKALLVNSKGVWLVDEAD